jgi:hypothetical protein
VPSQEGTKPHDMWLGKLFIVFWCLRRRKTIVKIFPCIHTIREGFANENMIDCKLKYLFKGRTGWTIKQIGDKEFILHFPSEELRHELTMFKVFEFVTDVVKARVEATNLEEIVNVLEETWIKASSSGSNEKNVIKEISYLVGDPIEVDESSLEDENAIRVKVNYRDATKIEGSTLVYIKGQGHMITWWSKKR